MSFSVIATEDEKKPILGHLEELRKRILVSIASVIILSALSYIFAEKILGYLSRYVTQLIFISPQEAFLSYLRISLFSGLVLSAPVILYNILRFLWIALRKREKSIFISHLVAGTTLFLAGAAFAYYIALPAAIRFLLGFSSDFVKPYISLARYVAFSAFLILAFAVAFEMPLFVVLLARLGIVNSHALRSRRKYIVVLVFVVAAALTPPDVITQVLLAVPLVLLYEISILFVRIVEKTK